MKALTLLLTCLLLNTSAWAWRWQDLWWRPDQQGAKLLEREQPEAAAKRFQDSHWRGVAQYRAKNFSAALEEFSKGTDPQRYYNLGNALAQLGQYEPAIQAYNEVLKQQPNNEDARFNRTLLEQLLKNRQQKRQWQKQPKEQPKDQTKKPRKQPKKSQAKRPSPKPEQSTPKKAEGSKQSPKSLSQWLRRIPDNPGGLLRQKFLREHRRKTLKRQEGLLWND